MCGFFFFNPAKSFFNHLGSRRTEPKLVSTSRLIFARGARPEDSRMVGIFPREIREESPPREGSGDGGNRRMREKFLSVSGKLVSDPGGGGARRISDSALKLTPFPVIVTARYPPLCVPPRENAGAREKHSPARIISCGGIHLRLLTPDSAYGIFYPSRFELRSRLRQRKSIGPGKFFENSRYRRTFFLLTDPYVHPVPFVFV